MISIKVKFPKIDEFTCIFENEAHLNAFRYYLVMSYGTFTMNGVEVRPNITISEILEGKKDDSE